MAVLPLDVARRRVHLPSTLVPEGRLVELPGRGATYVTDTPGPDPHSPTIILLHALGTTGLLTWFPAIEPLARRFRVVTLDQRWHGQGIQSPEFSLIDCADDVAALAGVLGLDEVVVGGYSMGSIVAQRVWRQHPSLVSGLVLGATTDRFQLTPAERGFFFGMGTSMLALRGVSRSRTALRAARAAARGGGLEPSDMHEWALREFRSTSPWAVGQALAALGRHHSRPWLGRIDVPTAVVVMMRDRVIPTSRQIALARSIPGATIHEVDDGHAGCVLAAEKFVPKMVEAAATVNARRRDFPRRPPR
ncbi:MULTISPECIES: alpha/beta fold hydrolase [Pimelobacter]|uniref:alpha/beta fold hydrolase n=1 Tax=Pimelobacter TaxID=2044 RepID=UPI001C045E32|nr:MULTISPECIES: alpha/beta hydrolase [Pimelobacter]MBU2696402.1 alpha/beta hydrolase [Pimelobacter sp. 30-1]UUW87871.1 alpha/beta hydrolase [Pimelobacter simplex]UUW97376.1 alpha/beta hydrolase [Pimelobacter simplex]